MLQPAINEVVDAAGQDEGTEERPGGEKRVVFFRGMSACQGRESTRIEALDRLLSRALLYVSWAPVVSFPGPKGGFWRSGSMRPLCFPPGRFLRWDSTHIPGPARM
jgi:hypothetical protein